MTAPTMSECVQRDFKQENGIKSKLKTPYLISGYSFLLFYSIIYSKSYFQLTTAHFFYFLLLFSRDAFTCLAPPVALALAHWMVAFQFVIYLRSHMNNSPSLLFSFSHFNFASWVRRHYVAIGVFSFIQQSSWLKTTTAYANYKWTCCLSLISHVHMCEWRWLTFYFRNAAIKTKQCY